MINEKMGIPDGLIASAKVLYNDIMRLLPNIKKIKYKKYSRKIGESIINLNDSEITIPIHVDIYPLDKNEYIGIYYSLNQLIKNEKKIKPYIKLYPNDGIHLVVSVDTSITPRKLIEMIEEELSISLLSHELKHAFDIMKNNKHSLYSFSNYKTFLDANNNLNIKYYIIEDLMYRFYTTHDIENSVRPSEILADMLDKGIKREDFIDYLNNSEIYQILKVASEYNITDFKNDVFNDDMFLSDIKDEFGEGLSNEEYFNISSDIIIAYIQDELKNTHDDFMDRYYKLYKKDTFFGLFNKKINNNLRKNIEELSKKYTKKNFMDKFLKDLNHRAIKTIRKINKLIDFLPEEKTIIHQKINKRNKLIKEYSKFYEDYKNGSSLMIVDVQKSFKEYFTELYLHHVNKYCEDFTKVYQVWDNHVNGKNVDKDYLYDDDPYIKHDDDLYKFPNQIELIEKRYNYDVTIDFFEKDIDVDIFDEIKLKENNKTLKQGDFYPTIHGTFLVYIGNNHIWFQVPKKLYEIYKEHRGKELIIIGGADSECLEDLYISGEAFGVKMKRNHRYIYSATHCPF